MTAREFECIPICFDPKPSFLFRRWKVIPGVFLTEYSGQLRNLIEKKRKEMLVPLAFRPTHLILIDCAQYEAEVFSRISEEGRATADLKKEYASGFRPLRPSVSAITKQVLLSWILHDKSPFSVQGSFSLGKERGNYIPFGSMRHCHLRRVSTFMGQALPTPRAVMKRKDFVKTAHQLDPYYRSGIWWGDQLAMALNALWEALCTPFPVQAFLSLMSLMESIVTADEQKLTQKLPQRTALLLTQDGAKRKEIRGRVRKLYKIRGKLTHGNSHLLKGEINTETLAVMAKFAIIPMSKASQLTELAIATLRAALDNPALLKIIQSDLTDKERKKLLAAFFLALE